MSFVDGSVEANLSLCGLVIHENALAVWKCFSLKQLQSLISHCHLNCQTYGEKHDTEAHIHSEKITNSGISPLVASLQWILPCLFLLYSDFFLIDFLQLKSTMMWALPQNVLKLQEAFSHVISSVINVHGTEKAGMSFFKAGFSPVGCSFSKALSEC